jgi:hypothetical protein
MHFSIFNELSVIALMSINVKPNINLTVLPLEKLAQVYQTQMVHSYRSMHRNFYQIIRVYLQNIVMPILFSLFFKENQATQTAQASNSQRRNLLLDYFYKDL